MADNSFSALIGQPPSAEDGISSRPLSVKDRFADILTGLGMENKEAYKIVNRVDDNVLGNLFGGVVGTIGFGAVDAFKAGVGQTQRAIESQPISPEEVTNTALNFGLFGSLLKRPGTIGMGGRPPTKPPGSEGKIVDFKTGKELQASEAGIRPAINALDDVIAEQGPPPIRLGETFTSPADKYAPKGRVANHYLQDESGFTVGSLTVDSLKNGVLEISIDKRMGKPLTKEKIQFLVMQLQETYPEAHSIRGIRGFDPYEGKHKKVVEMKLEDIINPPRGKGEKKLGEVIEGPLELTKQMSDQAKWLEIQKQQPNLYVRKYKDGGLQIVQGGDLLSPTFKTANEMETWAAENLGKGEK